MAKRLVRKTSERILGGVCTGLGEFLGIDPVFVRIFFIIWTVAGEFSVLIYMLLWVIIPSERDAGVTFAASDLGARFRQVGAEIGEVTRTPSAELITFAGVGLIAWGAYYLLRRLVPFINLYPYTQYAWPLLLILAGAFVLVRTNRRK